jgi:hypothetical protein
VTTFFDFYGMPPKWPGREDANNKSHGNKPGCVENAVLADIATIVDEEEIRKLRPYIQMHEFEALLFSEPRVLADVLQCKDSVAKLIGIREEFRTPEEINDSPQAAPSKRIEAVFPSFRKPIDGVLAAKRITVEKMLSQCPHFNEWVTWLRSLGGR